MFYNYKNLTDTIKFSIYGHSGSFSLISPNASSRRTKLECLNKYMLINVSAK